MKRRISVLLVALLTVVGIQAQVSYDSLVSYYPLNVNAKDVVGLNDGRIFGAIPTLDRFNQSNGAFEFNGIDSYIDLQANFDYPERTINLWFYADIIDPIERHIYISDNPELNYGFTQIKIIEINGKKEIRSSAGIPGGIAEGHAEVLEKKWYMITLVHDLDSVKHYLDGQLIGRFGNSNVTSLKGDTSALLGTSRVHDRYFKGRIDDVRIYNRAINSEEITQLYDEGLCHETIYRFDTIHVTVHDTLPVYDTVPVYETIPVYETVTVYDTIPVYDNIPVYDTIPVYEMVYVQVNDTVPVYFNISVTDTLFINTGITQFDPLTFSRTIKIYPNPTHDFLFIESQSIHDGLKIRIVNSLGSIVFETPLEQTQYKVDLSTWSGKGIYVVQVYDIQNNLIDTKKIILK